jgi:hypothetical protein
MMVAERERVDRLSQRTSTHKASLLALPQRRGTNEFATKKLLFDVLDDNGLSKPTDDVGQQAKDNLHAVERQASAGL